MSSDREPTTASPADPAAARREADLSELSDYVRFLADRMGLKDWTFEVELGQPDNPRDLAESETEYRRHQYAKFFISEDFFAATPEDRRLAVAREMVYRLIASTDDQATFDPADAASLIAAAWAPALPLPLVGWMRRATEVTTGKDKR